MLTLMSRIAGNGNQIHYPMIKYLSLLLLLYVIIQSGRAQTDTIIIAEDREQLVDMVRALQDDPRFAVSVTVFTGEMNEAGAPDGHWVYYGDLDKTYKIYEGDYIDGLKEGNWVRYAYNYVGQIEAVRENWQKGKLVEYASFYENYKKSIHFKCNNGVGGEVSEVMNVLEQIGHELLYTLPQSPDETRTQILELILEVLLKAGLQEGEVAFWDHEERLTREYFIIDEKTVKQIDYQYSFSRVERKRVFVNQTLASSEAYEMQYYEKRFLRTYYTTGGVIEEGDLSIAGNLKTGLWKGYYEDGKKEYVGAYRDGEKHGNWKYWDNTGNLSKKVKYKNGTVVD